MAASEQADSFNRRPSVSTIAHQSQKAYTRIDCPVQISRYAIQEHTVSFVWFAVASSRHAELRKTPIFRFSFLSCHGARTHH